jgi:penicillin-binding protein 2D
MRGMLRGMVSTRWKLVLLLVALSPLLLVMTVGAAWLVWRGVSELRHDIGRARGHLETGPQASLVYDRNGREVHAFLAEERIDVELADVSPHMVRAVLAAEDYRFYHHWGIDPVRILGAAAANLRARGIEEGASTITQQVARHELGRQRTWNRKLREVFRAAEIEARYDKDTLLETYLNTTYFGEGYYGVEAASRGYFGKSASELEPDEAAMLAGLIRAPSANSPNKSLESATKVRNLVLHAMRERGVIDDEAMRRYVESPLKVAPRREKGLRLHDHSASACGLYYFDEVKRALTELFGEDEVFEGGLRVFTAYDPDAQHAAERAVTARVAQIGSRREALQGALVAMEPSTGHVVALVGGRDFHDSSFNRATQARRQPGSAFKPFVWAAALERGWSPGTMLTGLDAPIGDGKWMPASDSTSTSVTLRRALAHSDNRAAAHLMQQVGVSSTIDAAQRLGIESKLPSVPSLALGTGEVSVLEMVSAFGALANQGVWTRPTLITRVEDQHGQVIWTAPREQRQALSAPAAYLLSSMMADVIDGGTGWRARQAGFALPAAGKTGTSNDYADAWFVGYTPQLVSGVWFGYDKPRTIIEAHAGDIAVPAWGAFMHAATRGHRSVWYQMPSGIEKVEICIVSGQRAVDACRRSSTATEVIGADGEVTEVIHEAVRGGVITELFMAGRAPQGMCPVHSGLHAAAPPFEPLTAPVDLSAELPPLPPVETAPPALPGADVVAPPAGSAIPGATGTVGPPRPVGTPVRPAAPPATPSAPAPEKPAVKPAPPPAKAPLPGVPYVPGTPVPPGYRLEKVASPDGTIITVLVKIDGGG